MDYLHRALIESIKYQDFEEDEDIDETEKMNREVSILLAEKFDKFLDNVKVENYYDFIHITAVLGDDFSLGLTGPNTGIDFEIHGIEHDEFEVHGKVMFNNPNSGIKNFGRQCHNIIFETLYDYDDNMHITYIGDDLSKGYWNHVKQDWPEVEWQLEEVIY